MTSWKDQQVLIVGGGIAGLAAALALARQGIPSQVIEQAAVFKEIGAGIQLGLNVFRMFERLGLIEPISALAVFPENLVMLDFHHRRGSHAYSARRRVPQKISASLCAYSSRRSAQRAARALPKVQSDPARRGAEDRRPR